MSINFQPVLINPNAEMGAPHTHNSGFNYKFYLDVAAIICGSIIQPADIIFGWIAFLLG
jgi:hypothetical protein